MEGADQVHCALGEGKLMGAMNWCNPRPKVPFTTKKLAWGRWIKGAICVTTCAVG